jgi:thiol-disulfide isomerase/thioredoxin
MFDRLKTLTAAALFTAIAASTGAAQAGPLAHPAPAPDFTGIDKWLNSEPLTLQQLRGKVVLVDFWTYSCINCVHTLPYVKTWNQKYKDQGLVVVGVHTPEYPFERDTGNVQTAIKRFGITYPVAQDNRYATWTAYDNQYWPGFYLIDKKGQVVYTHFGEGKYEETEAAIKRLLAQK